MSLIDRGPIKKQFAKKKCSCCDDRWARFHIPYKLKQTSEGWEVINPPFYLCVTCKKKADQQFEDGIQKMYEDLMDGKVPRVLVVC
jgi:hypothetical protein